MRKNKLNEGKVACERPKKIAKKCKHKQVQQKHRKT